MDCQKKLSRTTDPNSFPRNSQISLKRMELNKYWYLRAIHRPMPGTAEYTVQIMKRALRKHGESVRRGGKKRSLKHQLANCLFQYRNIPHSATGVTPSELFLKRKPRTKFSILLPNMEEHIQNQQGRQQWRHDKSHAKLRELLPHGSVNVRSTRGGMEK